MEVKKSPKADLEGKKSTWLLVGYVVVLAFMFVPFSELYFDDSFCGGFG